MQVNETMFINQRKHFDNYNCGSIYSLSSYGAYHSPIHQAAVHFDGTCLNPGNWSIYCALGHLTLSFGWLRGGYVNEAKDLIKKYHDRCRSIPSHDMMIGYMKGLKTHIIQMPDIFRVLSEYGYIPNENVLNVYMNELRLHRIPEYISNYVLPVVDYMEDHDVRLSANLYAKVSFFFEIFIFSLYELDLKALNSLPISYSYSIFNKVSICLRIYDILISSSFLYKVARYNYAGRQTIICREQLPEVKDICSGHSLLPKHPSP